MATTPGTRHSSCLFIVAFVFLPVLEPWFHCAAVNPAHLRFRAVRCQCACRHCLWNVGALVVSTSSAMCASPIIAGASCHLLRMTRRSCCPGARSLTVRFSRNRPHPPAHEYIGAVGCGISIMHVFRLCQCLSHVRACRAEAHCGRECRCFRGVGTASLMVSRGGGYTSRVPFSVESLLD